jgi:hypothetical protein
MNSYRIERPTKAFPDRHYVSSDCFVEPVELIRAGDTTELSFTSGFLTGNSLKRHCHQSGSLKAFNHETGVCVGEYECVFIDGRVYIFTPLESSANWAILYHKSHNKDAPTSKEVLCIAMCFSSLSIEGKRPASDRLIKAMDLISIHQSKHEPRFVYFMECGSRLKIGSTKSLSSRLASINTASSEKVAISAYCRGGFDLEFALHELFSDLRLNGEWFRKNWDLSALVQVINGMPQAKVAA